MRIGLVLDAPAGPALLREAAAGERAGVDLLFVPAADRTGTARDPLVLAVALGRVAPDVAVVVEATAAQHPLDLAEKLAVCDLVLGGRLTVAFSGTAEELSEPLDVVLAALASRPFRHEGGRFAFPAAGFPGKVAVTPQPAQLTLPAWLLGSHLAEAARGRHLPLAALEDDAPDAMAGAWDDLAAALPAHAPRPALRRATVPRTPAELTDGVVASLAAERERWGLSIACIRLPEGLDDAGRLGAIGVIGGRLRARLVLDALPAELVASWDDERTPSEEGGQA